MTTHESISIRRQDMHMTLTELSTITGLSKSTLSRIEHGEYKITMQTLLKIASALEINPLLLSNFEYI